MPDIFTNWILELIGAGIVSVGVLMIKYMVQVRDQSAENHAMLTQLTKKDEKLEVWRTNVDNNFRDHDHRINVLESKRAS